MSPPPLATFSSSDDKPLESWRLRCYTVIFEADTRAGRWFDQALIVVILLSVAVVMADSGQAIQQRYGRVFMTLEWWLTLLFTADTLRA